MAKKDRPAIPEGAGSMAKSMSDISDPMLVSAPPPLKPVDNSLGNFGPAGTDSDNAYLGQMARLGATQTPNYDPKTEALLAVLSSSPAPATPNRAPAAAMPTTQVGPEDLGPGFEDVEQKPKFPGIMGQFKK